MTRTVEQIDVELVWLRDLVNDHAHGFKWENVVWDRIDRLLDERKKDTDDVHVL